MSSTQDLQQRLAALQAELEALKASAEYLVGVRIERSPAGGTASVGAKEACKYARLRAGRGKLLPNSKKSLYIPVEKIAQYEAACDRGKKIERLERQIADITAKLWKLEQSQYQSWGEQGRKKRRTRATRLPVAPQTTPVPMIEPPPPPAIPAAILVLYRQSPSTPVHAVAAEIWSGNQKVAAVKPVHCMGMRADKVAEYIKQLLASLNQQFAITKFEDVVKEIPIQHCPIVPCPLKSTPTV